MDFKENLLVPSHQSIPSEVHVLFKVEPAQIIIHHVVFKRQQHPVGRSPISERVEINHRRVDAAVVGGVEGRGRRRGRGSSDEGRIDLLSW